MKARKLMCYGPFCHPKKIRHDRKSMITEGRKHYCTRCWNYLEKRNKDRSLLYVYIRDKPMITTPDGMILRQIKNLRQKYHYSYHGIKTALIYASKHSGKFRFSHRNFLRYVPFVYKQAQRWEYKKDRHNNMVLDHSGINNQVTHVRVDHNVFKPKKKKHYYDMSKF